MRKKLLTLLALLTISLAPSLVGGGSVYAADPPPCGEGNSAKGQVLQGVGQTGTDCAGAESGVKSAIKTVVRIISIIAGAIAIVMILVSGMKYMTSGGDSGKIASAKSSLIYALIGLAIAAVAQILVQFVVNTANESAQSAASGSCSIAGKDNLAASDPDCKP